VEITESGGVIKILPVYHYLGTLFTGGLRCGIVLKLFSHRREIFYYLSKVVVRVKNLNAIFMLK